MEEALNYQGDRMTQPVDVILLSPIILVLAQWTLVVDMVILMKADVQGLCGLPLTMAVLVTAAVKCSTCQHLSSIYIALSLLLLLLRLLQSCLTLSNPTDCSLPGSSAHGICQARVLEWGAIAFSEPYP